MDNKNKPQYYWDIIFGMSERTIKRLWIIIILLIVLLVGSNIAWWIYENQFEDVVTTEIEQDTGEGGDNYIVGGDFNGAAKG